jgi:hypothetical protein
METVIEGKYVPDYLNYDEKGGHYVNCVTKPGGGQPTNFRLERYCTGTYNVQAGVYPGPADVFPQTPGDLVPCKKCDGIWTLIAGRLTSTPIAVGTPGNAHDECEYVYEATWKCPATGEEQHRRESKIVSGACIVHG